MASSSRFRVQQARGCASDVPRVSGPPALRAWLRRAARARSGAQRERAGPEGRARERVNAAPEGREAAGVHGGADEGDRTQDSLEPLVVDGRFVVEDALLNEAH